MNNTPDSPAKPPDDCTYQGGNYWTLFTPGIWKVLHAVQQQFEQGRLFGARPGLRLAQGDQIAPEIAAAVDVDEAGQGHGRTLPKGTAYAAARSSTGSDCRPGCTAGCSECR